MVMKMALHAHTAYSAGAGALTWNPTGDSSIKPYNGHPQGEIVGLMVNTDAPTAGEYVRLAISQYPAYAENEVMPSCDSTNAGSVAQHIRAMSIIRGMVLPKSMDMVLTSVGGGNHGAMVNVRYGPPLTANKGGRTIRRYFAVTTAASLAWTNSTAIDDLDPTRIYGLRGMSVWSNSAHQNIGARLVTATSAARPGCVCGGYVDWVEDLGEYAVKFQGDEDPYLEVFSVDGAGGGAILGVVTLEELGTKFTGEQPDRTTGQSGGGSILGGIGSGFFR